MTTAQVQSANADVGVVHVQHDSSLIEAMRSLVQRADAAIWVLAGCAFANLLHLALLEPHRDHGPVYRAASAVLHGQPPYGVVTRPGDYVHTPGATLLNVPFGLVSERSGAFALVLASAVAFVIGTLAAAAATNATPRQTAIVMLAFGLGGPLLRELGLGNVDALCVLPLGLGLFYLTRGRGILGGALIGLALTIKPTVPLFVLLPLAMGSWSGTLSAVAVAAVLNLFALPLLPESSRFFDSVLPFLLKGKTAGYNASLMASMQRAGVPDLLVTLVRIACAAGLLAFYFRFRVQMRRHPAAVVALLVLSTVLVTSYFFSVYFVYLALAVGVLNLVRGPLESSMLALSAYLLLSLDTLRSSHEALDDLLGFRRAAGAALLLGALAVGMFRERRLAQAMEDETETPPDRPPGRTRWPGMAAGPISR
jgi:hypothetical protein